MWIEARAVSAGYGVKDVLHDASFAVGPGEVVGLLGPNGSGKTTLLRVLSGYLPTSSGSVHLDGDDVRSLSRREIARRIAFVPQVEPAIFDFSVRDVVLMGRYCRSHKVDTDEDFAATGRAMAAADIADLADRPITSLSGGEHRRVLLARALAQEASTLLLDEPTAHLDFTHQADILARLRKMALEEQKTVVAALHDLNLAAEVCTRVIILSAGRIVADAAPSVAFDPTMLAAVYASGVIVTQNPVSGNPLVLPQSLSGSP